MKVEIKFSVPVKCDLCVYTFNNSRELDEHMKNDHKSSQEVFTWPCISCDKKFQTDIESLEHLNTEHKTDNTANNEPIHIVRFKTPVKCDHCQFSFNNSRALSQHLEFDHQSKPDKIYEVSDASEITNESSFTKHDTELKLNYILDEFKNVKVIKANAKREMTVTRNEVNDLNLRYNLNSALFLVIKEEMSELKPGRKFYNDSSKVEMEVESVQKQTDKASNTPVTAVKWKIEDKQNTWESKVNMLLYHTNQGVHFQGGSKNGEITSCHLAADFFESYCRALQQTKGSRIQEIKEYLLQLDARRKYGAQPMKKSHKKKQDTDTVLKCDKCHFKTVTKTELKRHLFLIHQNKPHPTTMKSVS